MTASLATAVYVLAAVAGSIPAAASSLDKEAIRRPIRRATPKIARCYERQLLVNPKLEGRVTVSFTIARTGRVVEASASGLDEKVAACVARVVRTLRFPRSRAGVITVMYPFDFRR